MLESRTYSSFFLTHVLVPAGPIPTAQDPDGVYPYESFCETSRRPVLKEYRLVDIENEHLCVTICPDLGGKVHGIRHKPSGKDVLYTASVVRPVRILPRMAYVGGGIEVSFPISHTPVQLEPVLHEVEKRDDRLFVWCGEREVRFGMQWTVEYSLGAGDAFLTQRTWLHNPTHSAHPWMSWSNAGVPASSDTEFHFPGGPVLYHADEMKIIDWQREGPRRQCDIARMTGCFWREPDCNAFGVFTPSLGIGLYHVADPKLTPGIKLWSDGVGIHEPWVDQWTLTRLQCLEIQAGPIVDQSIKAELAPGAEHCHVEFWIPTDRPLDIHTIELPEPKLPPLERVPRFDFAREAQVAIWRDLLAAHATNAPSRLPHPPALDDNRWAPSGMENLDKALEWAAMASDTAFAGRWRLQWGAWLAGNDRTDDAIAVLETSDDDRAFALAARLYRRNRHDYPSAAACFRKIQSVAFARHPQVVVERDLALAQLGAEVFDERAYWIAETETLQDEWLIERRAALLIDRGCYDDARALLEATPFQLVHQRYARTRLWKRIEEALGLPPCTRPNWLGEDDLHEFGAYREHSED